MPDSLREHAYQQAHKCPDGEEIVDDKRVYFGASYSGKNGLQNAYCQQREKARKQPTPKGLLREEHFDPRKGYHNVFKERPVEWWQKLGFFSQIGSLVKACQGDNDAAEHAQVNSYPMRLATAICPSQPHLGCRLNRFGI